MEAPTSSYIGSNLYNREHLFSLAPPCHPCFSGYNQMEATTSCVQAPTWTSEDNSPPENLPTFLKYQIMNTQTIYADKSLLTILSMFCKSDLQQFVLQFFSSSTGLLCITFFCHSALLLLCLSFFSVSALHFISFCTSIKISYSASSPFSFLTVSFFFHSE